MTVRCKYNLQIFETNRIHKMMRMNNYLRSPKRHYVQLHRTLTSHEIRRQFLDYFIKSNDHSFIRSSPVVPFCDPTVAFVNAGMNQFKNVFLGKRAALCTRAVNSQKCVRVGGKHNDLSIVGTDGYHHTFFEMLGNWSFGDYFKKDACELAWNLLKGPYQINTSRLYVTYFGGDDSLQLPPDYECKDIWRSLGVSEDRILPFGINENFWEMGATGPCGPCTEIHIDHLPNGNPAIRASRVNAGFSDLTELWNVVFIAYNRNADGSMTSLPMKHIDTGMGMERLVAVLQDKTSNYETDLFRPIIDRIQEVTKAPAYIDTYDINDSNYQISTAYRTLADHSRMITACLADEMFPDRNRKLRRVIRKSLSISSNMFMHKKLLHEIVPVVVEILGDTYPEMERNLSQIHQVISYEDELLESLMETNSSELIKNLGENSGLDPNDLLDYAGFVPAFKEVKSLCHDKTSMSGDLMFKLYRTFGLTEEIIEKIAENEGLTLDIDGFAKCLSESRKQSKNLVANFNENLVDSISSELDQTDLTAKYCYNYNETTKLFIVPTIVARIVSIKCHDNGIVDVIVDKTNFYYESGGQAADVGRIIHANGIFDVKSVSSVDGQVVHSGEFLDGRFATNDLVELVVDCTRRTSNIRNHTALHLLNASVKQVSKCLTYQRSSSVTSSRLKLDLATLGYKAERSSIEEIEKLVRTIIQSSIPVRTDIVDSHTLYHSEGVTLIPGEVYPDSNLRILTIENKNMNFVSKEPCCGTHASNTAQLDDFCITNIKVSGRGSYVFTGLTGSNAKQAHSNGKELFTQIQQMKTDFHENINQRDFESMCQRFREILNNQNNELPYYVRGECLEIVSSISKEMKGMTKESLRDFIEIEMKNLVEHSPIETHPFIVHFLTCGTLMESVSLQKATRFCADRPIIVLSLTDGQIKAKCCVPKNVITEKFSAFLWLKTVGDVFQAQIRPPRGQNKDEVCNMRAKKISSVVFDEKLETAMQKANNFAMNNM